MTFKWKRPKVTNSLTALFDNGKVPTTEEVLLNSDLMVSLRNEVPELINFLFNGNGPTQEYKTIVGLALTDKYKASERTKYMSRNAANILCAVCKDLQVKIWGQDDNILYNALKEVLENQKYYSDSMIAGHFYRIVNQAMIFTGNRFLNEHPDIYDKVVTHLDLTSFRELLIEIICAEIIDAKKIENLLSKAIQSMYRFNEPEKIKLFNLISVLNTSLGNNQNLYNLFNSESIVDNLLNIGYKVPKDNSFIINAVFSLVRKLLLDEDIIPDDTQKVDILTKNKKLLNLKIQKKFKKSTIDSLKGHLELFESCFILFYDDQEIMEESTKLFFDYGKPQSTFFYNNYIAAFELLLKDHPKLFSQFIDKFDIPNLIIKYFEHYQNKTILAPIPKFTSLIINEDSTYETCEKLKEDAWKIFICETYILREFKMRDFLEEAPVEKDDDFF